MHATRPSRRPARFRAVLFLALLLGAPAMGTALSLHVDPADQTVAPGTDVTVDVLARSPGGVILGAFDLAVGFDPAVLTFLGVDFGTGLGAPTGSVRDVVAGTMSIEVAEVSLLAAPPQDGTSDLLLLTLRFEAAAPGLSLVGLAPAGGPSAPLLADAGGRAVIPTALVPGRVIVTAPEPSPLLLIAVSAIGLARFCAPRTSGASR